MRRSGGEYSAASGIDPDEMRGFEDEAEVSISGGDSAGFSRDRERGAEEHFFGENRSFVRGECRRAEIMPIERNVSG